MNMTDRRFFVHQAVDRTSEDVGTKAIPLLIRTLEVGDGRGRENAVRTLEAIAGQSFGEKAIRWQAWWKVQGVD
jgi:hypothetical protein